MELSIIIVNWNSKDYVRKCVASVKANTRDMAYEIIVVDGASYDGCGEMLAQGISRGVKFVQCDKNVGFARANNLGFEHSSGECILFLNPDTEVVGPAIRVLRTELLKLDHAGMVGAKLLNTDGSVQTSCIQAFPTILNQLLDAEVLRRAFPRHSFWGMAPLFSGGENPAVVQVLSGACLMMRRDRIQAGGPVQRRLFSLRGGFGPLLQGGASGAEKFLCAGGDGGASRGREFAAEPEHVFGGDDAGIGLPVFDEDAGEMVQRGVSVFAGARVGEPVGGAGAGVSAEDVAGGRGECRGIVSEMGGDFEMGAGGAGAEAVGVISNF